MTEAGNEQRFCGLEVEYGFQVVDGLQHTLSAAAREVVSGTGYRSDQRHWQRHGGCLYVDLGTHPEACTPEVQSGRMALVCDRANEQILLKRIEQIQPNYAKLRLVRNNTDGTNCYGCHENYSMQTSTKESELIKELVAFFVTRPLVEGSGRVVKDRSAADRKAWRFELSQRARFIFNTNHGTATRHRGFIKNSYQHLAKSTHRLQVVCGDTNILAHPLMYKLDMTALMIDLYEAGQLPVVQLADPILAVHQVSLEGVRASLNLADGETTSPLDAQWRYWRAGNRFARQHGLKHYYSALEYWRFVLEALERGDLNVLFGIVDWVTKRLILEKRARKLGRLTYEQAHKVDLQYHDLAVADSIPQRLRQRYDPPGFATEIERA